MADQKATALSAFTPVLSDILYGVDDPGGTPVSGKVTLTAVRDLLQDNLEEINSSTSTLKLLDNRFKLTNVGTRGFYITANKAIFWVDSASSADGTIDLALEKDAADTFAQRRGTNAQTFNIYNTFTDASNYERGGFKWDTNVLEVFAEAAGTGTQRDVVLNGANRATKIGDPSGGTTVDSEARTAINAIIDAIEAHGIAATS